MAECLTDNSETFREAILKTVRDSSELVLTQSTESHFIEKQAKTLAAFLADGNAGALVFLTGRVFAGKVLENIVDPDRYEVCGVLREAIANGPSMFDTLGIRGAGFCTPKYKESLAANVDGNIFLA
jgi:hypothetical protein